MPRGRHLRPSRTVIAAAKWVGWIATAGIGVVWANLAEEPEAGRVVGAMLVVMGFLGGDKGIRFVVPLGSAVAGYWLVADRELAPAFYSTAAQLIPVVMLALAIEYRPLLRDEVRTEALVLVFGLSWVYLAVGEFAALYATALCAEPAPCSPSMPTFDDGEPAGALVACGLAGGFTSLIAAAMLPRPAPR